MRPQAGARRVHLRRAGLAAGLLVAALAGCATVPVGRNLHGQTFAEIDRELRASAFRGSVLVSRAGQPLFREGYGEEARSGLAAYHVGSLTKAFTAAAVLGAVRERRLRLETPVDSLVPGLPNGSRITVRQLLGHTAGLPRLGPADYRRWSASDVPLDTLITALRGRRPSAAPGAKFAYANENYLVLGAVLQRLDGTSWDRALARRVFDPLRLAHTRHVSDPSRDDGLAPGRLANGRPAPATHLALAASAGGLTSTVDDVAAFARAMGDSSLLGPSLTREAFTAGTGGYGCGWVVTRRFDRPCVWHNGSVDGYFAFMVRFPEDDLVVVVLSNQQRPVGPLVAKLAKLGLDAR